MAIKMVQEVPGEGDSVKNVLIRVLGKGKTVVDDAYTTRWNGKAYVTVVLVAEVGDVPGDWV